jgi:hypothetical protein
VTAKWMPGLRGRDHAGLRQHDDIGNFMDHRF